jgi:hypothetical protein
MTAIQPLKYCPHTEPTLENCGSPTLRFGEALDFSLPFCLRDLFAWQQRSKSFSKTTQNARSSRRAAICSASVFRTMIVDEDIAGSSVSLREGATLAAAPGALR